MPPKTNRKAVLVSKKPKSKTKSKKKTKRAVKGGSVWKGFDGDIKAKWDWRGRKWK